MKNRQVISDEVEGTRMLCHTGFVEFFRLNATGAQIWDMCEQSDVDDVVQRVIELYPADSPDYLTQETRQFISALEEAGLLEIAHS